MSALAADDLGDIGASECAGDAPPTTQLLDEWRHAAAEVVHRQQQYIEVEAATDGTPPEWRAAWLRLWEAEKHLRDVEYALDHQAVGLPQKAHSG